MEIRPAAEVTAQRGETGYIGEFETSHLADDMAQTLKTVNAFFFEAEVSGLPDFPDMSGESTPRPEPVQSADAEQTQVAAEEVILEVNQTRLAKDVGLQVQEQARSLKNVSPILTLTIV